MVSRIEKNALLTICMLKEVIEKGITVAELLRKINDDIIKMRFILTTCKQKLFKVFKNHSL